jgi:hypothetical protein
LYGYGEIRGVLYLLDRYSYPPRITRPTNASPLLLTLRRYVLLVPYLFLSSVERQCGPSRDCYVTSLLAAHSTYSGHSPYCSRTACLLVRTSTNHLPVKTQENYVGPSSPTFDSVLSCDLRFRFPRHQRWKTRRIQILRTPDLLQMLQLTMVYCLDRSLRHTQLVASGNMATSPKMLQNRHNIKILEYKM